MDIADNANVDGVGQEEEVVPREEVASMTCMADAVGWTSYYYYCCCH